MVRPLRLEFAGAVYHVTSRGDRREDIFVDDEDRLAWMAVLALVCERFNGLVRAYGQMSNHYHLLLETPDANLSAGMRQLNGLYTQRFNRRRAMALPLSEYQARHSDRDEAMYKACLSGAYTMADIARQCAVHDMTVSRAVRKWESENRR
jgi:REP element-mobilizing transposase RayT